MNGNLKYRIKIVAQAMIIVVVAAVVVVMVVGVVDTRIGDG